MNHLYGYGSEEQSQHGADMMLHHSTTLPPYDQYHNYPPSAGYPAPNQQLEYLNGTPNTFHNFFPQGDVVYNPGLQESFSPFEIHGIQHTGGPFFHGGDSLLRSLNDEAPSLSLASTAHTISLSTVERCDIAPPQNERGARYQDALISQQSRLIDLKLECVDDIYLSHHSSKVSLLCFLRPVDENNQELKTDFFTPYMNSNPGPSVDCGSQPRAFVNFGGAKVRLLWTGEEFLHIKLLEQIGGVEHNTGYIKLVFSSLQEDMPMRVDVIGSNGEPNGFLILSYTCVNSAVEDVKEEQKQNPRIMPNPVTSDSRPRSVQMSQQTVPGARTFSAAKQKLAEEAGKPTRRQASEGGSHFRQSRANKGFMSRFGRWCCELPAVDLN